MRFKKHLILVVFFFFFGAKEVKAQIDTVFWFAAPWVTPDHWWRDPIAFHFSTFNNPTAVRVRMPATGYDTTINIPANSLFSKNVDFMMNAIESKPANTVLNSGFQITSDFPITAVYDVITRGPNYNNPETYSLKGQNGLGTEFVTPFQTRWNNQTLGGDLDGSGTIVQPYQQINIVATEDNTVVYITPRCAVVGGHPANVTYSVTLPLKGNVYTVQNMVQNTSVAGNNLAGSIVVSTKPVAVTVSDDSVNPSGGGGCYDLMGDQIVPTDVIGDEYIVLRGFLNAGSEESFFVTATENFTTVTINDGAVTNVILNQGDTYRYQLAQPRTHVQSDKPVYVLHMAGYGCELGEALLPPLNCAGSDIVTFPRTNPQNFSLNVLCPAGAQGSFLLNGSAALVPAGSFNVVPGTGGQWYAAQLTYTTGQIASGSSNVLTNSTDNFALGVINGGTTTGCLYHYMSSFIRRVYTKAGNDTILCNGEPQINLNGSVTGGSITGIWNVLDGTGVLSTPTNLVTSYIPSTSDYAQGSLTFVLSSTGNCNPVTDTVKVSFIQSPIVGAGGDNTFCKNNVGAVPISGFVNFASAASWSGGTGGAFGNSGSLTTTYTPSPTDLAADSVALFLTSAGSFFSCPNDVDTVVIHFTDPPSVIAGPNQVVCSSTTLAPLSGSISGPTTTGVWSTSGSGAFSPSQSNLITDYLISSSDTTVGTIVMTLTSTNNGNCLAVQDSLEVTIIDQPQVTITMADSICSNTSVLNFTGNVTLGFSTLWSVNGFGSIANTAAIPTFYTVSPIDTTIGYIDVLLSTTGICPIESDSLRIHFIDPPNVNAGSDQAFCQNEAIQLNGTISGPNQTGSWSTMGTGAFNPSNMLLSTLYFPSNSDILNGGVNLILSSAGSFGCSPDNDTLHVTFKSSPTAAFSSTAACQGSNTAFTDVSTTPSGSIVGWDWSFGDTGTSITDDPLHTYTASGTFNATLIVESSLGCFDTIQQSVTVNPLPVPSFTNTVACENGEIFFTDNSFISSGSINAWEYLFEQGNISNQQNPSYTYASSGTYSVEFTATSALGCEATVFQNVVVNPSPTAAFTINPNPALALEDVNFIDASTGNQLSNWYWNFGDGEGDNNQNSIHNYATGGVYPITLIVTDINGCQDTTKANLSIALLPVLPTGFTPNEDGENDVFIIRGGPFKTVDFKIYNNWGQLIYESTDALEGWNGMYKGERAPMGVYTWTFTVEMTNGQVVKKSGDVTLMR